MGDDNAGLLLALAAENAELRQQLASAQDLLVETAIDAGQLHARIEVLQAELAEVRARFDAWRTEASRMSEGVQRTA
jgi:predicted nuclease with TOPRIM domain